MTPPSSDATAPLATVAGRYDLLRVLGRGSFGRTYLAHDRAADRLVALKRFDPRGAEDWKAFELFEREAAALRSLRHHGIPEVFALSHGEAGDGGAAYLVMEYVEGPTLDDVIREGRALGAADVTHLFLALLDILEYLHGRVPPVLHRDIKPANVVLRPDGTPALVDFGAVRRALLAPDEHGSTVVGTYGYMPYEQYMGQATPASDLFALGATFLHLLTGRAPQAFLTAEGRLALPADLSGDPRLHGVLERLLRPSPAERFASAREARQALLAPAGAIVPGRPRSTTAVAAPGTLPPLVLPPAPRAIEGDMAVLLDRLTPSMWQYLDSTAKPGDEAGVMDLLWFGLLTVATLGAIPAVFHGIARARRRRLRRFLRDGVPGVATVLAIGSESSAFGEKIALVSYEFVADGALHRDADQVLPAVAHRWRAGDVVHVLYIPADDYDSIVVPR